MIVECCFPKSVESGSCVDPFNSTASWEPTEFYNLSQIFYPRFSFPLFINGEIKEE